MQFSSLYRVARVLANFVVVAPLPPAAASRTMQCAHSPVVAFPLPAFKAAAPSVDRRQGSPYTLVPVAPACQTGSWRGTASTGERPPRASALHAAGNVRELKNARCLTPKRRPL